MTTRNPETCTLGILASGGGSNFRAIHDAIEDGRLPEARIGVVLSDQSDAGALKIARERGIPTVYLGDDITNAERNARIAEVFYMRGVKMGIAAGYLRLVGRNVLNACPLGALNIHPAPLPRFGGKGMHGPAAHQAVIDSGVELTGPTVHLMDEVYDRGPILADDIRVPVLPGDTAPELAARVLPLEHDLYWRVIQQQIQRGGVQLG